MSIKYNGKIVAGNYQVQVVTDADTMNKGIIRIATQTEVEEGIDNTTAVTPQYLSKKQNILTSGTNISIENDIVNCDINTDKQTIIQNDDNTLTAIGQKTKADTIKIEWEGTLADYETGLVNGTISPNWYCYIIDDENVVDYNETVIKSELEASNIYTLGLTELDDAKGYKQLEEEYTSNDTVNKIDILIDNAFQIINNPMITEDGILYLSDIENYIYTDGLKFNNESFYIETRISLPKDNISEHNSILHLNQGSELDLSTTYIQCYLESDTIFLKAHYSDVELLSNGFELELGKTYIIRFGYDFDKNQLYINIYNTDGILLNTNRVQVSEYGKFFEQNNCTLFVGNDSIVHTKDITIDLNTLKIYKNNAKIYQACLKIPYRLSIQGSKIVDYVNRYRLLDWYIYTNTCEYYCINTKKNTFYLPLINNPLSNFLHNQKIELPIFTKISFDHYLQDKDKIGWEPQGSLITELYYSAVEIIKQLYDGGTDVIFNSIKCRKTVDGRYIALISEKDYVDSLFETTGSADIYILDRINNTFYLPRSTNKFLYYKLGDTLANRGIIDEVKFFNTIDSKANVSLDNLTQEGEKHFLNKSQITNCLLEVPQRIKYDLTDGTLTIKAGSIVIVPYGTEDKTSEYPVGATFLNDNFKVHDTQYTEDETNGNKFFVWAELVSDISNSRTTTDTATRYINIYLDNTALGSAVNGESGASTASSALFYNTGTNIVDYYTSGKADGHISSLPIGMVIADGTTVFGSINQIFNGMGYIGSTVWVDKGVKGLCPNGRNEDCTLNNIAKTTDKLFVKTYVPNTTVPVYFGASTYGEFIHLNGARVYDENENLLYNDGNIAYYIECGTVIFTPTGITTFNPKQPFRAVDHSSIWYDSSTSTLYIGI